MKVTIYEFELHTEETYEDAYEYIELEDDDIEYDEDGVAWWFDEEDEIWYYFDEDEDDWVEFDDEDEDEVEYYDFDSNEV